MFNHLAVMTAENEKKLFTQLSSLTKICTILSQALFIAQGGINYSLNTSTLSWQKMQDYVTFIYIKK